MPAVFLDVASREFTFFGSTFLATDGVLLMLLMLSIFVSVIALTALLGRGWCGWGCPQTVYMELLFRPIERLFEGDRIAQLKLDEKGGGARRLAKNGVFLLLSVFVANVFWPISSASRRSPNGCVRPQPSIPAVSSSWG